MLQHFRLIGFKVDNAASLNDGHLFVCGCHTFSFYFKVEDAASLKDIKQEFQHLRQLNISLYDCEEDSSDEEEEQEDPGVVGRASVEVASFFLQSALQMEVNSLLT